MAHLLEQGTILSSQRSGFAVDCLVNGIFRLALNFKKEMSRPNRSSLLGQTCGKRFLLPLEFGLTCHYIAFSVADPVPDIKSSEGL